MHRGIVFVVLCLGSLVAPGILSAAIIVKDTFENLGGTSGKTANDASSTDTQDISWFHRGANGAGVTVVDDAFAGGGSARALQHDPTGAGQQIFGSFDSDVSDNTIDSSGRFSYLTNVNEKLIFRFDFRYATGLPAATDAAFLAGIFNDPTNFVTVDNTGNTGNTAASGFMPTTVDSRGYFFGMEAGTAGTPGVSIYRQNGSTVDGNTTSVVATGSTAANLGSNALIPLLNTTTKTSFALEITRTGASSMQVELYQDNVLLVSGTDNAGSFNTDFNLLGFASSFSGTNDAFLIDNVQVESSVIPEPSVTLLLTGGLLGVAGLSRRRQRG